MNYINNYASTTTFSKPFYHGWIDNFLDQDVYLDLQSTFPSRELFTYFRRGKSILSKKRGNAETYNEFLSEIKLWKDFVAYCRSKEFIEKIYNFFPFFNTSEIKTVKFDFSRLANDGWIPVHIDTTKKIIPIVLYMAPDNWKQGYGGALCFCKHKNSSINVKQSDNLSFADVNIVSKVQYIPNRAVIMLKGERSFHGVTKVLTPNEMDRISCTITLMSK